jgi:hypothetical protein
VDLHGHRAFPLPWPFYSTDLFFVSFKIISFSIARVGMSMLSVEDRVSSVFIFLLLFME